MIKAENLGEYFRIQAETRELNLNMGSRLLLTDNDSASRLHNIICSAAAPSLYNSDIEGVRMDSLRCGIFFLISAKIISIQISRQLNSQTIMETQFYTRE